ncbi:DUF4283 domain-containing protein, partial [Cephalotus follicularis]
NPLPLALHNPFQSLTADNESPPLGALGDLVNHQTQMSHPRL